MEYDEHEQGERVRGWLAQNGSSLITGVALGLALVFGWQWWQDRGGKHREEASAQYYAYTEALAAKDPAKTKVLAAQLNDKFADTAYDEIGSLRQAAYLLQSGKGAEALALLRTQRAKVQDPALAGIYDIRIARLLLLTGKADEAAREAAKLSDPRYAAIVDELRGDIALARGRRDEARKDYERALSRLDQAAPTRQLLELKLLDAGGQPPAKPET